MIIIYLNWLKTALEKLDSIHSRSSKQFQSNRRLHFTELMHLIDPHGFHVINEYNTSEVLYTNMLDVTQCAQPSDPDGIPVRHINKYIN